MNASAIECVLLSLDFKIEVGNFAVRLWSNDEGLNIVQHKTGRLKDRLTLRYYNSDASTIVDCNNMSKVNIRLTIESGLNKLKKIRREIDSAFLEGLTIKHEEVRKYFRVPPLKELIEVEIQDD